MRYRYYAGIGSRKTPSRILALMTEVAKFLAAKGWVLRSGGAIGADQAFEKGSGAQKEIFLAKDATPAALALAKKFHPAWERCSPYVRHLHARNGMIVLGRELNDPVKMVICWTNGSGGTAQALRVARHRRIRIINLFDDESERRVRLALGDQVCLITVVNRYRHTPTNRDVVIMRPSPLGNPFSHKKGTRARHVVSSRDVAVEAYRGWIQKILPGNLLAREELAKIKRLAATGGVNLVCCCKPAACHGDVLKALIEEGKI